MTFPAAVLTVATTRTRLTLVRKVVGCWASRAPAMSARASRVPARVLADNRKLFIPLSLHPDLAIHEVFFLPDGHDFLEAVDTLESGLESGAAVRGWNNHRHRWFTHPHA